VQKDANARVFCFFIRHRNHTCGNHTVTFQGSFSIKLLKKKSLFIAQLIVVIRVLENIFDSFRYVNKYVNIRIYNMCVHIQSFNLGLNTTMRLICTSEDSNYHAHQEKKISNSAAIISRNSIWSEEHPPLFSVVIHDTLSCPASAEHGWYQRYLRKGKWEIVGKEEWNEFHSHGARNREFTLIIDDTVYGKYARIRFDTLG